MSEREGGEETERESKRSWREESWAPEKGGQQVLEGLRRGDNWYWRSCGGRSALVRSVCTVMLAETWRLGRPDSGLKLGRENHLKLGRETQTHGLWGGDTSQPQLATKGRAWHCLTGDLCRHRMGRPQQRCYGIQQRCYSNDAG